MVFDSYVRENFKVLFDFFEKNKRAMFLDLGCGDGVFTSEIASRIGTKKIFGTEIVQSDAKIAKKNGVSVKKTDLNKRLHYKDNSFDALLSHYSIEHLVNVRGFVKECYRILKPNGYLIVASDNLNSWLNIIAMIFGFQPFSLTRGLSEKPVGNPFAYWTEKETEGFVDRDNNTVEGAGSHIKVMSTRAAKDVFVNQRFTIERLRGAGYFPFFGILSSTASKLDPYHAHFWIMKLRKR